MTAGFRFGLEPPASMYKQQAPITHIYLVRIPLHANDYAAAVRLLGVVAANTQRHARKSENRIGRDVRPGPVCDPCEGPWICRRFCNAGTRLCPKASGCCCLVDLQSSTIAKGGSREDGQHIMKPVPSGSRVTKCRLYVRKKLFTAFVTPAGGPAVPLTNCGSSARKIFSIALQASCLLTGDQTSVMCVP